MDITTLSPNVAFALATSYFVTMLLVYYSDILRHNVTRLVKAIWSLGAQGKLIKLNKLDQVAAYITGIIWKSFTGTTSITAAGESACS